MSVLSDTPAAPAAPAASAIGRSAASPAVARVPVGALSIGRLDAPGEARDRRTGALQRHPDDGWIRADPLPMSRGLRAALRGLIRAMVPPPPGPVIPDCEDRLEIYMRRLFVYMNPITRFAFKLAIRALDHAPWWTLKSWRRLRSLPPERASAVLDAIGESRIGPLRDLLLVGRAAVLSSYFDLDEVHDALGYAPVPFMTERIALRERIVVGETPEDSHLLIARSDLEAIR